MTVAVAVVVVVVREKAATAAVPPATAMMATMKTAIATLLIPTERAFVGFKLNGFSERVCLY
jgi:hypothetical protein